MSKIQDDSVGNFKDDIIELHNHTSSFYETGLRIMSLYSFIDIRKVRNYVNEYFEKIYESMRKIKTSLGID